MAILKMFTADMPAPFVRMSVSNTNYFTRSSTQKRTGTYSMKCFTNTTNTYGTANMGIGGTATTLYAGFWVYCESLPTNSGCALAAVITEGSTSHTGLHFANTGAITIRRGIQLTDCGDTPGTSLGTLAASIGAGQSMFIEMYVKIHDSAGEVTVKVNGVQDTALAGTLDTRNSGSGYAQNLYFCIDNVNAAGNTSGSWYIDDVTMASDWPGAGGIYVRWPAAESDDTGWAASAGNKDDCIDEDTDGLGDMTDYITDDTATDKQSFTHGGLGFTASSVGAVEVVAAGTVPTGAATARVYVDSGGTVANGADTALSSAVTHASHLMTVDPDTSVAWDSAGVDALKFGVESRA